MEKIYERASNVCVNFFLAQVKSVSNFTVFCCKGEECCNFALFINFFFLAFYDYLWRYIRLFGTVMALDGNFGTFDLLHCFVENSLLSQFTHFFR